MGSLLTIVVENVSGMEQKKVESKVGEGIAVKVKGRKWKRYCFYKISFFIAVCKKVGATCHFRKTKCLGGFWARISFMSFLLQYMGYLCRFFNIRNRLDEPDVLVKSIPQTTQYL